MIDYETAARWQKRIFAVLTIVAAPYTIQKEAFPDFIVLTDEIALTFYEEVRLRSEALFKDKLLDKNQYEKIKKLDQQFDEMNKKDVWTDEALKTSNDWEACRRMAKEILLLGENLDYNDALMYDRLGITYIKTLPR